MLDFVDHLFMHAGPAHNPLLVADGYGRTDTVIPWLGGKRLKLRPARGHVYQEVQYDPGQAMQIDWGSCGTVQVGDTTRKVSVFVAVLCYSRLIYIEFTLSQRKAEFYRGIVNALSFFGGCPRAIIFDNLTAGVINRSGRSACFHPELLELNVANYRLEQAKGVQIGDGKDEPSTNPEDDETDPKSKRKKRQPNGEI
jgi:hypothetical protein